MCDVKLTGKPVPILLDGGIVALSLSASVAAEMRLPLKDTVEDGLECARIPGDTCHRFQTTNLLELRIGDHRGSLRIMR